MTNYVPKEKPPPICDALKSSDPKLQKEYRKMKIQEMKYNKYQTTETTHRLAGSSNVQSHNNHTGSTASAGRNSQRETVDLSPDMSPIQLYPSLEGDVREIRRFIKTLIYKQKTQENLEKIRGEWRAVALVIDRAFFYLYTLSIVVSLATMFPRGT